jgi:hypothetical protein
MSKKVLTHSMDVPKDATRWYVKKTREDTTGSFSSSLYSYRQTKNAVSETTTTDLPNGKTRIIIKHKWNTQADLDGYLTKTLKPDVNAKLPGKVILNVVCVKLFKIEFL